MLFLLDLYSFGLKYNLVLFSLTNDAPNEWSLSHANNFNEYISNYIIGAALNRAKDQKIAILLTIPINLTYKSLIRHFTPELKDRIKITIHNQPIGLTEQLLTFVSIIFGWFVSCLLLIPITIPFLRASYVLFPIHERITKTKLLLLMTGLSNITFWVCNFLFDIFNYIIAFFIIFIVFDLKKHISDN